MQDLEWFADKSQQRVAVEADDAVTAVLLGRERSFNNIADVQETRKRDLQLSLYVAD